MDYRNAIPTHDDLLRKYDLPEVEGFIEGLNVSREAGHLLNEALWSANIGPHRLLTLARVHRAGLLSIAANRVRPEASATAVLEEALEAIQ